ncbi:N-acetylmuramic acid 6-phosphate etherase [Amedibacterium intestinale]|uniref:N-acetylmuramic acid 6-phosphate etherase n=1 Tax=Amedibacterium intestinale TaxID=2583452 RepID=UPI000E2039B8
MENIHSLTTEGVNPNTKDIDRVSTLEMVKMINEEDKNVALAVEKELPNIAKAVDEMAERFKKGGRIIYIGAGSSGRLGTMDAVELTPTYNVDPDLAFGILAGGEKAMYRAVEGAEDSRELAVEDLKNVSLCEEDIVIGVAASGRTPYTISACEYANEVGALSIAVTCNGNSEMAKVAKISIAPVVGPEVVSGSTRMKAGTAQKMVLNMLSTGTMIKIGKVYHNFMVNVQPTNEKLVKRASNMLANLLNLNIEDASKRLEDADMSVATAIIMYEKKVDCTAAKDALDKAQGNILNAMELL